MRKRKSSQTCLNLLKTAGTSLIQNNQMYLSMTYCRWRDLLKCSTTLWWWHRWCIRGHNSDIWQEATMSSAAPQFIWWVILYFYTYVFLYFCISTHTCGYVFLYFYTYMCLCISVFLHMWLGYVKIQAGHPWFPPEFNASDSYKEFALNVMHMTYLT